jgi:hypothetical protein
MIITSLKNIRNKITPLYLNNQKNRKEIALMDHPQSQYFNHI